MMRAASPPTHHPLPLPAPSTSRRADIPEADIPPRKRLLLTDPTPRFEVGESYVVVVARQPGSTVARRVDYSFVDIVDASQVHLCDRLDSWSWSLDDNGIFSVHVTRVHLDVTHLINQVAAEC
ncbi:hypothetical protein Tco_0566533 [Tanacetum coccineum]